MAHSLAAQTLNFSLSGISLQESVIDHRGESALRYAWHKVLSKNLPRAYLFKDVEQPAEITKHYLISGRVQGVGFRAFTERSARPLGLRGWVRNLEDGRVEAVVTGRMDALSEFEVRLRQGPSYGRVDALVVEIWKSVAKDEGFSVRKDGREPCLEE
jgi:acylphosphatase